MILNSLKQVVSDVFTLRNFNRFEIDVGFDEVDKRVVEHLLQRVEFDDDEFLESRSTWRWLIATLVRHHRWHRSS